MDLQHAVTEFHSTYDCYIGKEPSIPPDTTVALRLDIVREEYRELLEAVDDDDIVQVADALGDLVYVLFGTAVSYGIDLGAVIKEIHRSNMTKLQPCEECLGAKCEFCDWNGAYPVRRHDGKVLKGSAYEEPNLRLVLGLDGSEKKGSR